MRTPVLCLVGLALLSLPQGARLEDDAVPLTAAQVKARWHERLDGQHFAARIRLEMELEGLRERRELRVWRDGAAHGERVLVRFEAPPDLHNVGLLYLEQPDSPNDYFLYQPATRRVRRLPESVADDDVYGIDLEFLGFGVAQTEPTEIEALESVALRGRATYKLRERARDRNSRFDTRLTWVDAATFVPVRTEHIRDGRTVLVAETLEVETVQNIPTPRRVSFQSDGGKKQVELYVEAVDYEQPIPEEVFSILALVRSRTEP